MGFQITSGSEGFGEAIIIVIAISVAIPVVIWFVTAVLRARADVLDNNDTDLEA